MPKKKADLIVFASGRGSNFRAIAERARDGRLSAQIKALVTNDPDCRAVGVAQEFQIPVVAVSHRGLTRVAHEARVIAALASYLPCDWFVLAGYMRLLTPEFISNFHNSKLGISPLINIHPSLLPSFAGKDGYVQAYRHGVKVTGVTVHFVGAGMDDGPIVAQQPIEVLDGDTEVSLQERGLKIEHEFYSKVLERLIIKKWHVEPGCEDQMRSPLRPRVVFES